MAFGASGEFGVFVVEGRSALESVSWASCTVLAQQFKEYYALGESSASFGTTSMSFPCEDWMKGEWAGSLLLQGDAEGDSVGAKPCNTQPNKTHNNKFYIYIYTHIHTHIF